MIENSLLFFGLLAAAVGLPGPSDPVAQFAAVVARATGVPVQQILDQLVQEDGISFPGPRAAFQPPGPVSAVPAEATPPPPSLHGAGLHSEAASTSHLKKRLELLVVGEDPQPPTGLDEVVAIQQENDRWCTGTLVDREFVLTAKHCLPAVAVVFGSHHLQGRRVAIAGPPALHPEADVALLRLKEPQQVAHRIFRLEAQPEPHGKVLLVGFGNTNDGTAGRKLAVTAQASGWGCDGLRPREPPVGLGCKPFEMVIIDPRRNDTCEGDSGGPVFEQVEQRWRLLAVTSRATRVDGACGPGGIYTRVDQIADWLLENLRSRSAACPK